MQNVLFILKFFGGLILLFVSGGLIGDFLRLDRYWKDDQNNKSFKK